MKNHELAWLNCLKTIEDILDEVAFKTWFRPIVPMKLEHNVLTLQVPNMFFYEYLEEHYIDLLKKVIRKELGSEAKLEYSIAYTAPDPDNKKTSSSLVFPGGRNTDGKSQVVDNDKVPAEGDKPHPYFWPGMKKSKPVNIETNLIDSLNFENFVEGECNNVARAVGMQVAAEPGQTAYNPMYIHGKTSLGKTHLAQAIGHKVKEQFGSDKIVLYVPANKFQEQYVEASLRNRRNNFKQFYQMVDVLILDDVHDLSGKSATLDSFFHLFNELHQNNKQIIITSDRAPSDLRDINSRLINRFKWALNVELTAPDYETRLAILKRKAYLNGKQIDDRILKYIAQNIHSNIRELEGVLVSLSAYALVEKGQITFELAKRKVDEFVSKPRQDIGIEEILKVVADYFDMKPEAIQAKNRKREIVQARQIAMYFAKKYTKASLSSIGSAIGGKDHSTVLYAHKTVRNLYETDKKIKQFIIEIDKRITLLK